MSSSPRAEKTVPVGPFVSTQLEERTAPFREKFELGTQIKTQVGKIVYVREAGQAGKWNRVIPTRRRKRVEEDTVFLLFGPLFVNAPWQYAMFHTRRPMGLSSKVKGAISKVLKPGGVVGIRRPGSGTQIERVDANNWTKAVAALDAVAFEWTGNRFKRVAGKAK